MISLSSLVCFFFGTVIIVCGVTVQEGLPPLQNEFPTKCLGDLGCFKTDVPFFHPIFRPVSLLPFNEEYINPKFWLFNPYIPRDGFLLDPNEDSIRNSNFNPYLETKVIIHGFTMVPRKGDVHHLMKDVLLMCKDYNVIIVDWSDSNQAPYPQAYANARVVGAQLAKLINFLQVTTGIWPESVHLIGHSLGAHLAGWAGEKVQYLGRITGLDPAGPYFYRAQPEAKLDYNDALFVDAIHTNAGSNLVEGLGLEEPVGHLDFYPNDGQNQPGCSEEVEAALLAANASTAGKRPLENTCSHGRAMALFIASVTSDRCRFEGTPCPNALDFISGKCSGFRRWRSVAPMTFEMGYHARKPMFAPPGQKYFLLTTPQAPYCVASSPVVTPGYHYFGKSTF